MSPEIRKRPPTEDGLAIHTEAAASVALDGETQCVPADPSPADPQPDLRQRINDTLEAMPRLNMDTATPDDLEHARGDWINLFDTQVSLEQILRASPAGHPPTEAQKADA